MHARIYIVGIYQSCMVFMVRLGADGVVRGATPKIGGPITIIRFLPTRLAAANSVAASEGVFTAESERRGIRAGTVAVRRRNRENGR
eukprot:COSAG05_NODE_3242_length_2214_cov_1.374941_1_plen_87_part_00